MIFRKSTSMSTMVRKLAFLSLCCALLLTAPAGILAEERNGTADPFTSEFFIEDCTFMSQGGNHFFSIEPGCKTVFQGENDGETVDLEITVLNQTRDITLDINGAPKTITTRVVEEREWEDGELVEVSLNYFAICRETNGIFYFGEDVDNYDEGEIENHDGAWIAGQGDNKPGLIMPGTFLPGAKYYTEIAPGEALDQAENTEMGLTMTTPAGTWNKCVKVRETSGLDPEDLSIKYYCPGVGMVEDDDLELVEIVDNRTNKNAPLDPCAATYDAAGNVIHVPCLDIGNQKFWLDLSPVDVQDPTTFELDGFGTD